MSLISDKIDSPIIPDVDSEPEDDPGKLLNEWLGELDKMKQTLDTPSVVDKKPIPRRISQPTSSPTDMKQQYRCSLINIEETQDEELDAILSELSVLESQFNKEMIDEKPLKQEAPSKNIVKPARTGSPDNDSAFCDNVSVLSSSSSVNTDRSAKSSSGVSSSASPSLEDKEAKLKAEKIRIAIEKIKEASITKLFIKVFTADSSAKSILVDENMTVSQVCRILAEKNHIKLHPKWALVELVPDLYMERIYEDHENIVENLLLWKIDSKNTLWFIERPEKFDLFIRPENYLFGSSSSQKGNALEEYARQELLEEFFCSTGAAAPAVEGFVHLKVENKKSWKKFYFVLRSSGLYYAPKGKKSSKDLVCLSTFDVNQIYYGTGWRKKYKAPSDFTFAIKNPTIQVKNPKYIRYFCVETENDLHKWVTGIRMAKSGKVLFDNYRKMIEEIANDEVDLIVSNRHSGLIPILEDNKPGDLVLTPNSENKSFDSALESGGQITEEEEDEDTTNTSSSIATPADRPGSSSSGCNSLPNGFDSDFPIGGTIKKRPPRLLHSRLSIEDDADAPTIQIGGGGTLLRHPKKEPFYSGTPFSSPTDPLSQAFENSVLEEEDFPPPPPPGDLARLKSTESLDFDLPPPPPELLQQEPVVLRTKTPRKISFDDRVHLIEDVPPRISPNKLTSPPKAFLRDLQRVMTKKWQVAEKCRENVEVSPHYVLGFRDEVPQDLGSPQAYSRDDTVGQWVLNNSVYSDNSLYAVSQNVCNGRSAVVLREPTPEKRVYSDPKNVNSSPNYSTLSYETYASRSALRSGVNRKPPPPPPRRNEQTQLTASQS